MSKQMLIDATHAEETRVVVLSGPQSGPLRVEEFDFESLARKQLRGNIYLAKVTRVEPSLQAAFVEYGGNRQGFLAFNEIHPDYYQIPVADREKLMAELAREAASHASSGNSGDVDADLVDEEDGDDLPDEERRLRQHLIRRYKIQEVIKRRQILLIQVVKEERGNKGAALTTYLSLAGRYCVLMPNTGRGGGISRKITNAADRKRLKAVANGLEVPHGMGLIVRTAGAKRTKQEIKRDYDYLLRVWENVRETTLKSNAPALIYEEEDLVKRAIRDLFDKDVDNVLVEGEDGYRTAKDFMRMIMPSQAKKIQLYKANSPLFARFGIEEHISKIYSPTVPLRSGGYLVINQTEALVAIDVNSGKSTKERNIEATALKTNIEAAEEAARQMRLRDLAGLIVIDFIDMDEGKNNRAVEKKLKDALAHDRARIQMGKISGFGLMEISRQRRRTSVLEGTTIICPHCQGMGRIRSVDSAALAAMRAIDLEAMQNGAGAITVSLPQDVALYVLNEKQAHLARLKIEWGLKVSIAIDNHLTGTDFVINRTIHSHEVDFIAPVRPEPLLLESTLEDEVETEADDEDEDADDGSESDSIEVRDSASRESADRRPGGGRRRRRRGGRDRDESSASGQGGEARSESDEDEDDVESGEGDEGGDYRRRRRRRGRRGGRRGFETRPRDAYGWVRARTPSLEAPYVWIDPYEESRRENQPERENSVDVAPLGQAFSEGPKSLTEPVKAETVPSPLVAEPSGPVRRRARPRRSGLATEATIVETRTATEIPVRADEVDPASEPQEEAVSDAPPPEKPRRGRRSAKPELKLNDDAAPEPVVKKEEVPAPVSAPKPVLVAVAGDPNEIQAPAEKPKRGWWRR